MRILAVAAAPIAAVQGGPSKPPLQTGEIELSKIKAYVTHVIVRKGGIAMPSPASITAGASSLWQQGQSQQAQRAADQAAQAAQSLQAQARDARAIADRAQDDARSLEMKAAQAQATATQASLSVQTSTAFLNMQASSSDVYTVVPKLISFDNKLPAQISAPASSTGQIVGSMINTTA